MDQATVLTEPYPGYLIFLENSLEFDLANRNVQLCMDALDACAFYEDGENDEDEDEPKDPKTEGLLNKLGKAIQVVIDKIVELIRRFMRVLSGVGKKHLTSEQYMQTQKGMAEYETRCNQIRKEIDDVFLSMRPVIGMIADVTKMDPEKVEFICDAVNNKLASANWTAIAMSALEGNTKHKQLTTKYADECRNISTRIEKAKNELTASNKNIKGRRKKLNALNRCISTTSNMANHLLGSAARLDRKSNKIEAKYASNKGKS